MAGKSRPMSQIKQLIRLKQQGYAIKAIARCLSLSKNTVKTYLFKIGQAKLNMNELLELEDPILDGLLNAGNPAYRDARFEDFKERLSYFHQELGRPGVTRKLLWEEYKQGVSDGYELSQFCFHLGQYLKVQKRSSMVMEHTPADKLYIDFSGKKLHFIDGNTGEIINCEIFVACLPFSNYCYATAVPSQKTPDFLDALDKCIQFLGGVPRCIVPDNLKSAVIKSDRYEPEINRCMEDLANHYGTVIVPARAGKPRDKSAVENHVKIIYTQVFAKLRNRSFFSLSALNSAVEDCVLKLNQTRMQNRSYCRQERFLSCEKHLLLPLPEHRFALKYYAELKIGENGHVYLGRDRHFYSAPSCYIGKKAQVIYTKNLVHIFVGGKQVALHQRSPKQNAYTTLEEHLDARYREFRKRNPAHYLTRANAISPVFSELVQMIFDQKRHPEQLYRTCDGLFRLQRTYSDLFIKACQVAITHRQLRYKFVEGLLITGMVNFPEHQGAQIEKKLPLHENIRNRGYYS